MQQPQSIQLHIPNPCHEDWSQMTPNQQGRHCAHCSKTVIDFTTLSDAALYDFFSKDPGRICGRLHAAQLHRPIHIPPQPHSRLYHMVVAMGFTLLLAHGTSVYAQAPLSRAEATTSMPHQYRNNGLGKVKGTVLDKNKQPIIGATVKVLQGGIAKAGTVTDFDGNYQIYPLVFGKYEVEIAYTGYGKVSVKGVVVQYETSVQNIVLSGKADTVILYKKNIGRQHQVQTIDAGILSTVGIMMGDVTPLENLHRRTDTAGNRNKVGNSKTGTLHIPELPKDTSTRPDTLLKPNRKIYNREEVQKMHMR